MDAIDRVQCLQVIIKPPSVLMQHDKVNLVVESTHRKEVSAILSLL